MYEPLNIGMHGANPICVRLWKQSVEKWETELWKKYPSHVICTFLHFFGFRAAVFKRKKFLKTRPYAYRIDVYMYEEIAHEYNITQRNMCMKTTRIEDPLLFILIWILVAHPISFFSFFPSIFFFCLFVFGYFYQFFHLILRRITTSNGISENIIPINK